MIRRLSFAAAFVYAPNGDSPTSKRSQEFRARIKAQDLRLFEQIAEHVAALVAAGQFAGFFGSDVTLVPMPGHAPLAPGAISGPSRIARALQGRGLGSGVEQLLERTSRVTKSAFVRGVDRPRARDHFRTLAIKQSLIVPSHILLVDDFVTRGATLIGAAARVQHEMPATDIKGFALVRSHTDGDVSSIRQPCTGEIELTEEGESYRRP